MSYACVQHAIASSEQFEADLEVQKQNNDQMLRQQHDTARKHKQEKDGLQGQVDTLLHLAVKREEDIRVLKAQADWCKDAKRLQHIEKLMVIIHSQNDTMNIHKANMKEHNAFREKALNKDLLCVAGCGDLSDHNLGCDSRHGICNTCLKSMAGDDRSGAYTELQCPFRCQHDPVSWAQLDAWLADV